MSTYILMRILESAPRRYELGIRLLTLGCLDKAYDRLASRIHPGQRVLDLGCGTGALTLRAAQQGAKIKGIDINAQMIEIAWQRVREAGLMETVDLVEMGVAELDREETESYDAVMSGLCFSELSQHELAYTLKQVVRILRPAGLLLGADEIKPRNPLSRMLHSLIKAPLAVFTYVITQQTTHAVSDLSDKLTRAGLSVVSVDLSFLGTFSTFVARKPIGSAA
jgi:ubiquinone/menaquinone biosynthesis C-methylase UbiE